MAPETRLEGLELSVVGKLAGDPGADAFARAVGELIHRYAAEVVAANRLCPFLHNVETGLGAVVVILENELDVDVAARAVRGTKSQVVHAVFPLAARDDAPKFERFGNAVAERLRRDGGPSLVHATFHPAMVGGTENAHRLVGLLRRSPDAFLQFIPPGMQGGGTVMAGEDLPKEPAAESTFVRMTKPGVMEGIVALVDELHAARARLTFP
jgi:hypothetical protein